MAHHEQDIALLRTSPDAVHSMEAGSVNSLPLSVKIIGNSRQYCSCPMVSCSHSKNHCNRPCGVSFPQKCQHEIGVTKEHRNQHLAALTALHGIHFHNGNIRIGCCIFQEIVVVLPRCHCLSTRTKGFLLRTL